MIADPIAQGIKDGWQVQDASTLTQDLVIETDVVIIGTGAGGGISAEVLTQAGLDVVMLEEGPLKSSQDFRMQESDAYPQLYQESAGRKTKDKAITILQGRCVGGSTTINWTSSFRTPANTLAHWAEVHGLADYTVDGMAPYFEQVEQRLNISQWLAAPNQNNGLLRDGLEKLGFSHGVMSRNIKGCWNLGYCGVGCPTNAKQSMLVTTIPSALTKGARLFSRARAERLLFKGDTIQGLVCVAMDSQGIHPSGVKLTLKAKHYVLAAGAIGSAALLLRSDAPDPYNNAGKRTFLHPVNAVATIMPDKVEPYYGAPQSVYSDHFLWPEGRADGRIGYKIEVPPLHPLLASTVLEGHGESHHHYMQSLPYIHALLALNRDGFHPQSPGGQVELNSDGTPRLDYPLNDFMWEGMRRAFMSMTEIAFAAGSNQVLPLHRDIPKPLSSWNEAKQVIADLSMKPLYTKVVSAHVMGGCAMGVDEQTSVTNSDGRHHQLSNLSVIDGSVFPTSIGTNPQVSIYGVSLRNATHLAQQLTA